MRLRPGVAIDLGTVNTLIYVSGRGIVLEEPSARPRTCWPVRTPRRSTSSTRSAMA